MRKTVLAGNRGPVKRQARQTRVAVVNVLRGKFDLLPD
ncbi:hypothetical protein E2C01_073470 [Portunus trituberculatus]|uniref:Uncharacterized protein n=1 Tax=Portunus trituberculatus TaxID=210409 RepID=A0A5B7I314_PORTR|nr:hypothetical protein [Portunus trituberculatus]